MDILAFKASLIIYFVSAIGYMTSLYVKRVVVAKMATWVLTLALLNHTLFFVFGYAKTGRFPIISLYETLSFFTWVMTAVYLVFQLKTKTRVLGAFVSPIAFLLMILASVGLGGSVPIPPSMHGKLVMIHAILAVTGEAFFCLAACAGAMYLIQEGLIKRKKMSSFSRILPSLTDMDRINHISLLAGFPFLTIGILAGSIWAQTVWGSHWQWDPKQVWTLAAWFFYALIIHQRVAIGWKGHKAAISSLLAFVALLVSLVAVTLFAVTAHTFI